MIREEDSNRVLTTADQGVSNDMILSDHLLTRVCQGMPLPANVFLESLPNAGLTEGF